MYSVHYHIFFFLSTNVMFREVALLEMEKKRKVEEKMVEKRIIGKFNCLDS